MTDQRPRHIADDEELLGRFVLGTLRDDERREFDEHLRGCDACAAAVLRERRIAAGARRLGRDQLKQRLRESAVRPPATPLLWPKIVSVAAVLGVIVGAGLYYDWLGSGAQQVTTEDFKRDIAADERAKAETSAPATVPRGSDEGKDIASARREPLSDVRSLDAESGAKKSARAARRAEPPAAAATEGDVSAGRGAVAGAVHAEQERADAPVSSGVYWTEGTVLRNAEEVGAAQAADKVTADSRLLMKEGKLKSANQLKAAVNEKQFAGTNYQVNQAPASALPRSRQMVQRRNSGGEVQTLVTQEGNTTTMTLYLDSLADPVDVKNASVVPATDDSVVVTLGKQRIGYRLQQEERKQQTRPVK